MLNDIFDDGYSKINAQFGREQSGFLSVIAEARNMPVQWIKDARGIFIPNNEFMLEMFGVDILAYDCYRDGLCVWDNALIFPICGADELVAGFAGFFPFDYLDKENDTNYYAYSSQTVFQKGRFLYFPQGNLIHAVQDEYLLLVDGIFDAISLCGYGYHAAALMGSNPTQEILMQLRFVKHVILVADNDSAGYRLFDKLQKHLYNVELFKFSGTKDADEALKSSHVNTFLKELNTLIKKLKIKSPCRANQQL